MIWWVLGAAVVVVIGLVYVMRHESELCAPDERVYPESPRKDAATAISTRRAA